MASLGFRGWWIVAVAFASQGIAIGLTIIPYGLFATPITEEFGASVGEFQTGLALLTLVMTGAGSLIGRLLDRGSIRVVMACGSLLMAVAFYAMSFATQLWQLALAFGVVASVGVAMAGPLPATTVIAKWFDRKRGRAVGMAALGIPVAGLVLTPLAGQLLVAHGWRGALQVFAGISLSIAPMALAVVRNTPESVGQRVDGELAGGDAEEEPEGPVQSVRDIVGSRNFWVLATAVGLVFGFGGGWNANAPRFGEDLGYTGERMATLIGMAAGLGAPATLLFGVLADRWDNRVLLITAIAAQAAALATFWTEPSEAVFIAAFLAFGFAGGALLPVYAAFVARLFGAGSFGTVMGLAGLVMLPFGAAAPVIGGALRDASGSYESALATFTVAFVLGAVLLAFVSLAADEAPDRQESSH